MNFACGTHRCWCRWTGKCKHRAESPSVGPKHLRLDNLTIIHCVCLFLVLNCLLRTLIMDPGATYTHLKSASHCTLRMRVAFSGTHWCSAGLVSQTGRNGHPWTTETAAVDGPHNRLLTVIYGPIHTSSKRLIKCSHFWISSGPEARKHEENGTVVHTILERLGCSFICAPRMALAAVCPSITRRFHQDMGFNVTQILVKSLFCAQARV